MKQFKTFGTNINSSPYSCTYMLCAYLLQISDTKEIIIVGDKNSSRTKEMIDILNDKFNPNLTTLFKNVPEDNLLKILPHLDNYKNVENITTAYVCSNNTCSLPITAINEFKDIL